MKKKYILLFVLAITCLLLTGCGKKLKNDKVLFEYLKTEYPYDEFEIIEYNKICPADYCLPTEFEKHYVVKSKTTGISFEVEDLCTEKIPYWCTYSIYDNYYEKALEPLNDMKNTKMYINYDYYTQLTFKLEKYKTKKEMVEDIWNIIKELNNYPYKYDNLRNHYRIIIENKDVYNTFTIDTFKSKKTVQKIVDKID